MQKDDDRIVVVIVISNMEYGGAQRQIVELVNHMDRRRFRVHVVSLSTYVPLADDLVCDEKYFHIIKKRGKYDFTVVPRLAVLLRRLHADIVHGYLFDAEVAASLAGLLANTRAIGRCERNADYHFKSVQRVFYRLTRPTIDFCIANSQAGAEFNRRELHNRPGIYYTVHNGVDTERFHPGDRDAARALLSIPPAPFVIGVVGSFKPQKNHLLIFRAFRQLLLQHEDSLLLLVGDELAGGLHGSSEYHQQMKEAVINMEIDSRCIFLGNKNDVETVYPACDAVALPSLFEGTPNVALESMACGVPVVATDVADNALIIEDGTSGYVVPLEDEDTFAGRLIELTEQRERCRQMGESARERMIRHFSCRRLAEKTAAVYLEVLGHHSAQGEELKSFRPARVADASRG